MAEIRGFRARRWLGWMGVLALAGALTGCAVTPPTFTANVTTLAEPLPPIPSRGVYRFAEVPPAEAGRLEYRTVRDALRIGLSHAGLTLESDTSGPAKLIVGFDYRTTPFQSWAETAVYPTPGMWPYYPYPYMGYYGPGWGFGMMMSAPMYQTIPVEGWRYTLDLSIRDRNRPDMELYHVQAVHENLRDNRYEVLPLLVEAALEGYPQAGTHTRTVRLPQPR